MRITRIVVVSATVLAFATTGVLAQAAASSSVTAAEPVITELKPLPSIVPAQACLTETGSRLAAERSQCVPANGRVYGRDDMDRIGAVTLSDVLRRDPSIFIRAQR
jgi:hypothetical protein